MLRILLPVHLEKMCEGFYYQRVRRRDAEDFTTSALGEETA